MPICKNCNEEFPNKIKVDGKTYNLSGRKFCLKCSELGARNTRQYIVELKEDEAFCIKCLKIKIRGFAVTAIGYVIGAKTIIIKLKIIWQT